MLRSRWIESRFLSSDRKRKQPCFRELILSSIQCLELHGQGVSEMLHALCAADKRPPSTHTCAR